CFQSLAVCPRSGLRLLDRSVVHRRPRRTMVSMKGNEKASAEALKAMLQNMGLSCTYVPVYPENGFPDFDFKVQDETWAVECTDLHQCVDAAGTATSRVGVHKGLERLCEAIRAKATPGLNRKYLITAFGPGLNV